MELADYNIIFIHIKGKNNVLADAISRLKALNIYKEILESPEAPLVSKTQGHLQKYMKESYMCIVNTTMLHTEQIVRHNVQETSITIIPQ